MESVATGINKMGDAFTALAAANPQQKVTDQSSTSMRSFAEIEEGRHLMSMMTQMMSKVS